MTQTLKATYPYQSTMLVKRRVRADRPKLTRLLVIASRRLDYGGDVTIRQVHTRHIRKRFQGRHDTRPAALCRPSDCKECTQSSIIIS
ncbi:hypothetical protein SERLA73DRAFT_183132 [Serpula lacrymans var. lacrymans S7.3]|uniref:Uncharacterized protein n=2 Tax=Serpula lacrymans var. lacrymans TaxID=341189 RepID=F8Q1P2_SERL3|nr:uncharacterized protein SERLADRAFT_470143 [Serpula lacrymans var. lacrymans S7.9]EGN98220.1 hypothetical protein SERLA73DRAFT_183132 [Serpula lacrymans var. lacrymans S7.3]EGO23794.1 hypothetical protein SERLADRAFT_470143 [Serpula lacrymans var. lacrymans S7.9]